jgi:hypothetical protein
MVRRGALAGAVAATLFVGGCSSPAPTATRAPVEARTTSPAPAPGARPAPAAPAVAAAPHGQGLAAPKRARTWDEFRVLAAHRLVDANRSRTYLGVPPEPLFAIPVLEIELNGDGSVRRIVVMRNPSSAQARDTVQLAIDAVHRAAPFGDVSHLPRPWKFSEVFLFGDDRRFKPRTLDL